MFGQIGTTITNFVSFFDLAASTPEVTFGFIISAATLATIASISAIVGGVSATAAAGHGMYKQHQAGQKAQGAFDKQQRENAYFSKMSEQEMADFTLRNPLYGQSLGERPEQEFDWGGLFNVIGQGASTVGSTAEAYKSQQKK